MKPIPLLIAVSLAGNAALLAFLVVAAPGNSSSASSSVTSTATAKLARSPGPEKSDVTAGVDPKLWQKVGDADFAAQIKRLRAAGFPPSVVRAIITAQISDSFAAKRKALNPPPSAHDFWKNDQPTDPKIRAALRELAAQQTRLIADLLGPDPDPNPMQSVYERRQYAGLPPAKIDQLTRVKHDYDEMRSEAMSGFAGGGTLLPEDRAKLALLDKEQRADIAQILSPQEMEDYDLRNSNTANQMRYQLSAFNPNEAEFRTIYQLQHAFDEQYSSTDMRTMMLAGTPASQDAMRQRADAQKQLVAQIKAALGPDRGAEYERATDFNFQAINRVVDRLDLPKAAATDVWTLQKDMEQRARAVQTNRELSPQDRNAQLAALSTEATTKLTTSLGQRGLDIYKQNGGYWLQNLQPRPVGAPGGPGGGGGGGGTTTTRVIVNPGG